MKIQYILLFILSFSVLTAQETNEDDQYLKLYEKQIEDQNKLYEQQLAEDSKISKAQDERQSKLMDLIEKETKAELAKAREQSERYDKLLAKWEEQAKRQDAILKRQEALLKKQEQSKN
jgi:hypothetical protein